MLPSKRNPKGIRVLYTFISHIHRLPNEYKPRLEQQQQQQQQQKQQQQKQQKQITTTTTFLRISLSSLFPFVCRRGLGGKVSKPPQPAWTFDMATCVGETRWIRRICVGYIWPKTGYFRWLLD